MRILIVEDEPKMADVLRRGLTRAGLAVDLVELGADALIRAARPRGRDHVRRDRARRDAPRPRRARRVPTAALRPDLVARAHADRAGRCADRVDGLDAGADDYLAKPFAFDELLARMRALAPRGPVERAPVLEVGDLRLDPAGHRAWRGGTPLELSAKELAMLEIFMRNPEQVLSPIVDAPRTAAQLRPLTQKVIANNGFADGAAVRDPGGGQHVVPDHVGGSSPIKHVIYIVNENRTYDQVLGDVKGANGDPGLTLFGPKVTPNHHSLATRFTTLDNLYAAGEVSDDGWEWTTGANASTLDQKSWPTNYGGRGHFYVGEGGTLGAAPGQNPNKSYLWDLLDSAHLS